MNHNDLTHSTPTTHTCYSLSPSNPHNMAFCHCSSSALIFRTTSKGMVANLSKTLLFLSSQRQRVTSVTKVLISFLCFFGTAPDSELHQCARSESYLGVNRCNLTPSSTWYHTSRENEHCRAMWLHVSGSWQHKVQTDGWSMPLFSNLSAVHRRFFSANHIWFLAGISPALALAPKQQRWFVS
jgi:hypothetical protein